MKRVLSISVVLILCLSTVMGQGNVIYTKDMEKSYDIDHAIKGKIPGLQVVGKSGMPGEGAYLNSGGIHSLYAANTPLIVVNGVPYMYDTKLSTAINGYSRSLFAALNINDIRSITLLTGSDAAKYGSLGSNGVLDETEQATSDNLNTRYFSFVPQYGLVFQRPYRRRTRCRRIQELSSFGRSVPLRANGASHHRLSFSANFVRLPQRLHVQQQHRLAV